MWSHYLKKKETKENLIYPAKVRLGKKNIHFRTKYTHNMNELNLIIKR